MDLENKNIDKQIQQIFENNKLIDLQAFIKRKTYLNETNMWIMYVFHILQTSGIVCTTISAGYNDLNMIWLGVCLNASASLLSIYEKNNNAIIKKLSREIIFIKKGTYVDENVLVDTEDAPTAPVYTDTSNIESTPTSNEV